STGPDHGTGRPKRNRRPSSGGKYTAGKWTRAAVGGRNASAARRSDTTDVSSSNVTASPRARGPTRVRMRKDIWAPQARRWPTSWHKVRTYVPLEHATSK